MMDIQSAHNMLLGTLATVLFLCIFTAIIFYQMIKRKWGWPSLVSCAIVLLWIVLLLFMEIAPKIKIDTSFTVLLVAHLFSLFAIFVFQQCIKQKLGFPPVVAFSVAILLVAVMLYIFSVSTFGNTLSGRGMGGIILIIYPVIDGVFAAIGVITLSIWGAMKATGFPKRPHKNSEDAEMENKQS